MISLCRRTSSPAMPMPSRLRENTANCQRPQNLAMCRIAESKHHPTRKHARRRRTYSGRRLAETGGGRVACWTLWFTTVYICPRSLPRRLSVVRGDLERAVARWSLRLAAVYIVNSGFHSARIGVARLIFDRRPLRGFRMPLSGLPPWGFGADCAKTGAADCAGLSASSIHSATCLSRSNCVRSARCRFSAIYEAPSPTG